MNDLVTVTGYGPGAPSSRVRVFDWLDHLGLDAQRSTYLGTATHSIRALSRHPASVVAAEATLRRVASAASDKTILLSRQASPFSNGAIERRLLTSAALGVYDFDDALFDLPATGARKLWSKAAVWRESVLAASCVVAGNDYLADAASVHNSHVVVIPSCVATASYTPKANFERGEVPRAIWIGSPSTEHYLQHISPALIEVHRRTGFRLTIVSSGDRPLGPLDLLVDRIDWNVDTFARDLLNADFGIMPLEDTPWARGKCAYKLLQYGAAGLPMIGSPVGVNGDVLSRARGLAPSGVSEWRDALLQMIDESASQRAERGASSRFAIELGFSFSAWEDAWTSAIGIPCLP